MKKLVLAVVLGLLISPFIIYKVFKQTSYVATPERAEQIYKELIKYTGAPGAMPMFIIGDSDIINAYAAKDYVEVTSGMLNFVQSDDELAGVIAHEIGHEMLGHTILENGLDSRINESNADKYGIYLMLRAGYNPCYAKDLWLRFKTQFGNGVLTQTHPSEADRVDSEDFPSCHFPYNIHL